MQRACMKTAIFALGLVVLLLLAGTGLAFLIAPTRTQPPSPWFAVARLSSLSDSGEPQRVAVPVSQRDVWTRLPDRVIGHVFVRRLPGTWQVIAMRAEHHFFRIPVVYDAADGVFRSSCWLVEFDLNGKEVEHGKQTNLGDDLEQLPVRVSGDVVWIRYDLPE